ncbi:MAG: putative lipid II flippase FtsW [Nitrospirae bacterium]|nr:putative lipid II flippase FtsW [Nitrospirota bacterium]
MKQSYDKWLLLIVLLLILIGLTAVYSSTSVISPDLVEKYRKKGVVLSQFGFIKKQLLTVFLGILTMSVAFKVPLKYLKKAAVPLLVVSLVCLLLVFTKLGITAGGARRWIRIWPSAFQPSELVKLSMVIFLSGYMSMSGYNKEKFLSFVIPISIMGMFQVVFLRQPDFGAVMSLALLTVSMLFLSGMRLRYLFSLGVLGIPVVIKLISEPYRWKRVAAFLDPWKDAQGSGFQLVQSFIALGSGGLTGVGLGEGKQKLFFLPEVHTDFIFSMIGEEVGFIGAVLVAFLFFVLFLKGIFIARKTTEQFHYYLAFGISMMIAIQAIFNFAVVTGMVPTKGLPLPFISYGGSSLIINMTAVGLLLNVSRAGRQERAEGKFMVDGSGSAAGLEARVIPREGYPIKFIRAEGLVGKSILKKIRALIVSLLSLIDSFRILRSVRPSVVIGVGGYASAGVILSAYLKGIPTMILEQNSVPGFANRFLSRFADAVAVTYQESINFFPKDKTYLTGNPIRKHILKRDEQKAYSLFHLDKNRFTVFVFGGSLGARSINYSMIEALNYLLDLRQNIQFLHQTGEKDHEKVTEAYRRLGFNGIVVPFIYQMAEAYTVADMVVCRAGATTLAEIAAIGKPAVLIPYPYAASNHQEYNARKLEDMGAAKMIPDRALSGEALADSIRELYSDEKARREMQRAAAAFGKVDAAEKVVDIALSLIKK